VWERLGYGAVMYEIVPGFVANSLVIWLLNHFTKPEDQGFYKKLMEAFHRETA
jgi:sodium/proline symporter